MEIELLQSADSRIAKVILAPNEALILLPKPGVW